MNNRVVSTAIAFVNAEPHLGHALELVLADALVRSHRTRGSVWFTTGTDENSLKSVRAAEARGISTRELVDQNAAAFRKVADRLGTSYDRFIRTSADPDHRHTVERLWAAARADLYRSRYSGLYCVGCEAFLGERDLIDGRCPEHKTEPEKIEEENIFFRLSKYTDAIRDRIRSGELAIRPERVRDEILDALDRGLPDLSVSRPASRSGGWGLSVPDEPSQVIYVWFDALANYLTAAGDRWQASHRTHVIGKGIAKFHAIYWPAFLLSAGVPLPNEILVHGYLTLDGHKIGKSLGNTIDPNEIIDRYGVDALRWYLLRHVRSAEDGDFSRRHFEEVYQAELAHGIGNLVGRVLGLCQRFGISTELHRIDRELEHRVNAAVDRFALDEAASEIWAEVDRANAFLQKRAPWKLAKQESSRSEAEEVVRTAVASVRAISRALASFLPGTAKTIDARLEQREGSRPLFEDLRTRDNRS